MAQDLMKMDWDSVEKLIVEMLSKHLRLWGWYDYLIINDHTVLVKVYDEDNNRLMFTIKAELMGEKLEIVEAW
jgi:hypothetical protein